MPSHKRCSPVSSAPRNYKLLFSLYFSVLHNQNAPATLFFVFFKEMLNKSVDRSSFLLTRHLKWMSTQRSDFDITLNNMTFHVFSHSQGTSGSANLVDPSSAQTLPFFLLSNYSKK
jgi:hypothetical protein